MSNHLDIEEERFDETESQIGKSSRETDAVADRAAQNEDPSFKGKALRLINSFSLYDWMLVVSLLFITIATLRLFFAIREYGGWWWEFPWRVNL